MTQFDWAWHTSLLTNSPLLCWQEPRGHDGLQRPSGPTRTPNLEPAMNGAGHAPVTVNNYKYSNSGNGELTRAITCALFVHLNCQSVNIWPGVCLLPLSATECVHTPRLLVCLCIWLRYSAQHCRVVLGHCSCRPLDLIGQRCKNDPISYRKRKSLTMYF